VASLVGQVSLGTMSLIVAYHQVVSLFLVLLSLSICSHLVVLRSTFRRTRELITTTINYHPSVTRSSLLTCVVVVLTLVVCHPHVC
jgi:hypothetical protein